MRGRTEPEAKSAVIERVVVVSCRRFTTKYASRKVKAFLGSVLVWGMRSVPGADRGPRAGSPRGVVVATGYRRNLVRNRSFVAAALLLARVNPVAIAPGTDSMTCVAN